MIGGPVASRAWLVHLCTIQRNQGTTDSHGGKAQDWQDHLTAQACRGWVQSGSDVVERKEQATVALQERRLMLPLGTDVTQLDRVGDVTYRGATVLDGPHIIEAVLTYVDRLELLLRKVG